MRIATFNVNGLAGSEAAVHKAWKVLGIDILCLVETWLRPTDEVYIGLPHDVLESIACHCVLKRYAKSKIAYAFLLFFVPLGCPM